MSNQSPELFAPSAPAGIPVGPAPARTGELSRIKPIIAMAAYVLYAVVCVVGLFVLNNRASLANRLAQGDSTITLDQANAADDAVTILALVLIAAFIVMLVAGILADRNVRKVLGKEDAKQIRNRYGMRFIWILWALLWVAGTATQNLAPGDPQALASADHRSMFLLGARAVLLSVIAVLTMLVYRTAARLEHERRLLSLPRQVAPLGY